MSDGRVAADLGLPAAATAGLLVPLAMLDRRMQAAGGPGIIPFELAGAGRSRKILRAWGSEGRRAARASLLLDFPFLVAYTWLNVRLARRASRVHARGGGSMLAAVGPAVAGLQVAAGACDAIENSALLGVVARKGDARLAQIARGAALLKFAGLGVGWLYGSLARLRLNQRRAKSTQRSAQARM